MPDNLAQMQDYAAPGFDPANAQAIPLLANNPITIADLLSHNLMLTKQNQQLSQTLARLTAQVEPTLNCLTRRQRQVMTLVLAGQSSKIIADELNISPRTVENHRAAIMRRTGATSLPSLVRLSMGLQ